MNSLIPTLTALLGVAAFTQTTSGAFDAVVDFERLMSDPARPDHLAPMYDSGDHLHPNDAGYRATAAPIDLGLFRENGATAR